MILLGGCMHQVRRGIVAFVNVKFIGGEQQLASKHQ